MVGHGQRLAMALAVMAGMATLPRVASAQLVGNSAYNAMYANPYANPYTNPFMNPYMTQGPVQGNPALYFLAAQQMNGGIGSGRISGTRPAPARASAAPVPDSRRATDVPGGGASQYFSRSYQPATSAARYYNRSGRYYRANGH